jgi:hypothetical protein
MKVFFLIVFLLVSGTCYSEEPGTYQLFTGRVKHTGPLPKLNTYVREYLFKINTKTGETWVASEGEVNTKKDTKDVGITYRKWDKFEYEQAFEGFVLD